MYILNYPLIHCHIWNFILRIFFFVKWNFPAFFLNTFLKDIFSEERHFIYGRTSFTISFLLRFSVSYFPSSVTIVPRYFNFRTYLSLTSQICSSCLGLFFLLTNILFSYCWWLVLSAFLYCFSGISCTFLNWLPTALSFAYLYY